MSNNLVVVALPADDELVWKVSSEKKPHMTLLFLGEADQVDNLDQVMLFVQHATQLNEHGPFYLDVDHRGTLGPDEADVVFFNKRSWNLKWVKQFRNQLLQNTAIRTAYDSVEQYEEWTPHLTLGYPTAPAKPIPDDRTIYSVMFDRIAVWTGDFEGPDFRLEWPDREDYDDYAMAVHSSRDAHVKPHLDEALEHFGVKGMQWGKRIYSRDSAVRTGAQSLRSGKSKSVVEKPKTNYTKKQQAALLAFGTGALANKGVREAYVKEVAQNTHFQKDKKWEKDFQKAKGFGFDDQKFTKDYNDKWKAHDFSKENWDSPSPKYQKYIDGYFKEMNVEYAKQFSEHYGSSPSGKYEAHHVPGTTDVKLRKVEAQHSLEDGVLVTFRIKLDENGLITGLEQVEDSMEQATDFVADVLNGEERSTVGHGEIFVDALMHADDLEHSGVKGMKWGVRKEQFQSNMHERRVSTEAARRELRPAQSVRAYPTIGTSKKTKATVATKGGEDHPPTDDAIKVAAARQKLKKSGVHALSNNELRDVATRLNLENQVMTLESKRPKSLGRKFVDSILGNKQTQQKIGAGVGALAAKKLAKTAAVAAL